MTAPARVPDAHRGLAASASVEIVHHEQGTDEWLAWRDGRVTASDACVAMSDAPYWYPVRTWEDLRLTKMGMGPERSPYLQRVAAQGTRREQPALRNYARAALPVCVQSAADPRFAASLDGFAGRMWWEVKHPAHGARSRLVRSLRENRDRPWRERIIPSVWWQLVHQAGVLDDAADRVVLVVDLNDVLEDEVHEIAVRHLTPDWPVLRDAWERYLAGEPQGRHDPAWAAAAREWKEARAAAAAPAKRLDAAERALKALGDGEGCGVKVATTERRGTVDWRRIVERDYGKDEAAELGEGFRKPTGKSVSVTEGQI